MRGELGTRGVTPRDPAPQRLSSSQWPPISKVGIGPGELGAASAQPSSVSSVSLL